MATLVHIKDLFQFVCFGLLLLDICSGQAIWSFNGTTEQILPTENNIHEVHLTQQLVYQGRKYSQLYISKDGLVGFNNGIQYKAVDFSGPNVALFIDRPFIAPYHYDGQGLDSLQFYTGHVYYHQFNTTSDMQSRTYPSLTYLGQYLRSQVIGSDSFVPTWGLQVTWTNVTSAQIIRQGPCQGTTDSPCRTNTFQLVLLSDGADSYAIFNYGDMQINPDTYDQAGFNGGYGTGWFGVFKSGLKTGKLLNRLQGSDTVGRYVFKISSPNIVRGGCTSDLSNILYGEHVTYHFDFEDLQFSNFTLDPCTSSNTECWYRGTGRENTMSGPVEDHTYGAPRGHYMYMDPYQHPVYGSSSSSYHGPTRYARMTSPEFPPSTEYCVRFMYTMYGTDVKTLNVYAKVGSGNGYPVLTKQGQEDQYWHMAEISLNSEYTASPFKLVFEATTNSYYRNDYSGSHTVRRVYHGLGYIAIDDVYVYNTSCGSISSCPPGARKIVDGNVTSCYSFHVSPASWYDAVKTCKSESIDSHLVSIDSQKEQQTLVDIIHNDAGYSTAGVHGWYTSGNDERSESRFVWADTGYPYSLSYTDWHIGQPNNVASAQDCLLMEYSNDNFEWGDVNCDDKHPFICETHV